MAVLGQLLSQTPSPTRSSRRNFPRRQRSPLGIPLFPSRRPPIPSPPSASSGRPERTYNTSAIGKLVHTELCIQDLGEAVGGSDVASLPLMKSLLCFFLRMSGDQEALSEHAIRRPAEREGGIDVAWPVHGDRNVTGTERSETQRSLNLEHEGHKRASRHEPTEESRKLRDKSRPIQTTSKGPPSLKPKGRQKELCRLP